jgi:hypothetical protein
MLSLMHPHKKISSGFRSGECGGPPDDWNPMADPYAQKRLFNQLHAWSKRGALALKPHALVNIKGYILQ